MSIRATDWSLFREPWAHTKRSPRRSSSPWKPTAWRRSSRPCRSKRNRGCQTARRYFGVSQPQGLESRLQPANARRVKAPAEFRTAHRLKPGLQTAGASEIVVFWIGFAFDELADDRVCRFENLLRRPRRM